MPLIRTCLGTVECTRQSGLISLFDHEIRSNLCIYCSFVYHRNRCECGRGFPNVRSHVSLRERDALHEIGVIFD